MGTITQIFYLTELKLTPIYLANCISVVASNKVRRDLYLWGCTLSETTQIYWRYHINFESFVMSVYFDNPNDLLIFKLSISDLETVSVDPKDSTTYDLIAPINAESS